jgi:hypothetical protein
MRFTIRELLLLLAAVAVGCAALKYAGELWYVVVGNITLLTLVLAVIVVAVDRGRNQAAAIGVALSLAWYGLIFMTPRGELPSEKILQALYWTIVVEGHVDPATGQEVPGDPLNPPAGVTVTVFRRPDFEYFLPIGHLLCALLLGFIGGRFASWVYDRRIRRTGADKLPN